MHKSNMTSKIIYKPKLIKYATYTRLFVLFLGFISNKLIPDHNADAFVAPTDPTAHNSTIYMITNYVFGGFLRWDAQYFQHIARHGYTYENSLAFFPLFPMIGRGIALTINYIYPTNLDAVITLVYILLNYLFFIGALKCLYDLTILAFNARFAFITGCLFIVNPATIFFVAPYTESLYAYLTFKAIYHSTLAWNKYNCFLAVFLITMSSLTRSNGLINIGFLGFFLTQGVIYTYRKSNIQKVWTLTKISLAYVIFCTACCAIPILFFAIVQYYHYYNFCTNFSSELPDYVELFGRKRDFVMPGEHSKHHQIWCNYTIPLSYGYVQDKYWKVGFMRYYEWKQIPNFLLALPIIVIMLWNTIPYLIQQIRCYQIFTFGFLIISKDVKYKDIKCRNDIVTACFLHGTFLTLFCIFFVHIQVSTRILLSANPSFYWICTYYFKGVKIDTKPFTLVWKNISKQQLLLLIYSISYVTIGTILFCNYLPWT